MESVLGRKYYLLLKERRVSRNRKNWCTYREVKNGNRERYVP
jgi:hypothetical protein